jgi:thiol-disulfide isomerase/thioredoxin
MTEIEMGQASPFLRRTTRGFAHWCPGCEEMHVIFDRWQFNGDVNRPTFTPSVKITGLKAVVKDGKWTGEYVRGADGKPLPYCCHYFLTAGQLHFCPDSLHALFGKTVPLPELPDFAKDLEV